MPYLVAQHDGDAAKEFLRSRSTKTWFDAPEEIVQRTETVKHIGSSFTDPGEDWNRYELYDKEKKLLASYTIPGY